MKLLYSRAGPRPQHILSDLGIDGEPAKSVDIAAMVRGDGA